MPELTLHPDVANGIAAALRKTLGEMTPERERQHIAHYAHIAAIHEACHAVAYVLLGAELISVDIVPNERGFGYTLPNLEAARPDQIAQACFAGCIGELIAGPAETFVAATDHDVGQAVVSCVMLCNNGDPTAQADAAVLQRVLRQQWNATVTLLLRPAPFAAVHKVAAALLEHGRLTGPQVETIVERTRKASPAVKQRLSEAKQDAANLSALLGDLSRRWLTPCGTRLREGAVAIAPAPR